MLNQKREYSSTFLLCFLTSRNYYYERKEMLIDRIRTAYGSSIVFDTEMQGSWCSVHLKIPFKYNNETTMLK